MKRLIAERLTARPLSAAEFAPFGQVVAATGDGPQRHAYAARATSTRPDAQPNITFMRVPLDPTPYTLGQLERHPHSHQIFVPLNGTRQLVVVCPSDGSGEPDLDGMLVFVSTGGQAVNYDAGVWHAPRTAIAGTGEFVMLRWDDGGPDDTHHRTLETPVVLEVEF